MMSVFYKFARPLLFALSPEQAHNLTVSGMKHGLSPSYERIESPTLKIRLWEKTFPNPLGMAAGFDKNAQIIHAVLNLGFGFTEIGTVTPLPQKGNPKPRVFRNPANQAVINKMGFPNQGLDKFQNNLTQFLESRPRIPGLIGLNIGMNKNSTRPERDYIRLIRTLAPMADYLAVNISSPNTPGLRDFQSPAVFRPFIEKLIEERNKSCQINPPPLLVKFSPDMDLSQQETLADLALSLKLDGLILTNTTLARSESLPARFAKKQGGLSGAPLKSRANKILRNFYKLTGGQIPLIGVGGISDSADAYERIRSGASLIQLYTSLIYKGPDIAINILQDLKEFLKRDGYQNISDAVGADVDLDQPPEA